MSPTWRAAGVATSMDLVLSASTFPASASHPAASVLRLAEILDLKAAGPLSAELMSLRGLPVELDGAQVRRLGGQCLQVLISAWQTWAADDCSFHIVNPSADLQDALELFGAADAAPLLMKDLSE